MIPPEQRARIRRLYFAEHWKIGTIATELGIHHDTVRHAIELDRFVPVAAPMRPTGLDPYKPLILETLEKHPRLRATRLFEMVRARGFSGSVVQVRRFAQTVRPRSVREAFFRLETLPGEQGQVDWASFGSLRIGRAERKLSCFVMVLSFSRAVFARFAFDQTLESFVRGHVAAFEAFGGVPRNLLYDNLKSVVLERHGQLIRYHPHILELAGHYHFAPQPCAPYRGNEKGKVERAIHYLRHSFFEARRFAGVDDLNGQLARWLDEVAMMRVRDGRVIRDRLDDERPRLVPLPQHRFSRDLVRAVASGKTPYIRFDGNEYSIPHTLVRKPLTLAASETAIRILDAEVEIARHARSYDRGVRIEDRAHLENLGLEKKRARDLRGRDRLRDACPHADAFLLALAERQDRIASHVSLLLSLLDRYGARDLDVALVDAITRGAVAAQSVAHILDQLSRQRRQRPPLPPHELSDPRSRVVVTPHALAPYDTLARKPRGGHE
ncbi:MAG TPA: IS21 family transposase [Polyangiaceae bacterium]|jgi:transposase|nr:IS21 family transposase [Polyangiaceae bacterium]